MTNSRVKRSAVLAALPVLVGACWLALTPAAVPAADEAKGKTVTLHHVMEGMSGTFRKIRRQVRKSEQNAATLALIVKMQHGVLTAWWAPATATLFELAARNETRGRRLAYQAALLVGAALVAVTGAFGGALLNGWDHHAW
jgi:predicted metal-binding membrane protein